MGIDDGFPLVLITQADPAKSADPLAARKGIELYHEAIRRSGGRPVGLDELSSEGERRELFERMDGLLLSGGADIEPARYGQPTTEAHSMQPGRDQLEHDAFHAAAGRTIPVLGICRGFQAINVFSGGQLVQHVDGHVSAAYGQGDPTVHQIDLVPGTRLAALLAAGSDGRASQVVNSYHHQAVVPEILAPGLVASAWTHTDDRPLIEGLESADDRFLVGIQCHPERTDSTPAVLERLFEAFVAAARERSRQLPRPASAATTAA
jgi:putative glutamine amidotransferase